MTFPPETDVRLGLIPHTNDYYVFLATPPLAAGSHLLKEMRAGALVALLTHEPGCKWTDRRGEQLAVSVLVNGGAVIMQFATMQDALAAHDYAKRKVGQAGPG
jgi:hypothetical protein